MISSGVAFTRRPGCPGESSTGKSSVNRSTARVPRPGTSRTSPSSLLMRGDQRNSLLLKATPEKAGRKYLPTLTPTTSWIMIPISSWTSRRFLSVRYSIGSGPKMEA